jgi:hypothetical protein
MKQVWNIFRKDLRQFWREIVVTQALLVLYSWNDVRGWSGERMVGYAGLAGIIDYRFLAGLTTVLLPMAWAFLIVRVVQAEALVGDRQFWVTRPYEWKKLLAAKMLFVVLTINAPLLVADVLLLARAGFNPPHYIAGLLWMQLLISLALILSILTLATVTASVVQLILALLGVALYMSGVAWLASVMPSSGFSGPADSLERTLLIVTCVSVAFWQYARRKTTGSRWLIAALALAVVLIVVATPYNSIVNREFPRLEAGEPPPVRFALLPAATNVDADTSEREQEVEIQLPLSVSGLSKDSIVVVSGFMVSLEAPNGLRWNSGWVSHGIELFPDNTDMQLPFNLKKSFFEQVKSASVKARISLALTEYRDKNRREFVTPRGEFLLQDVGFCSAEPSYIRQIQCRSPLRTPSSMLITSDLSANTCPVREGESRAETRSIVRDWYRNSGSGRAGLGISPIKILDLYLWYRNRDEKKRTLVNGICPGTPLVISNPEFVRQVGTELDLSTFHLADYPFRQFTSSDGGFGIRIIH